MADSTAVSPEPDIHGCHLSPTPSACFTEPRRRFCPPLATKAGMFASAGSVEEALTGAECAVFLVNHDVFRGISAEKVKGLMTSPVVVDGKNLFAGGEGIVYLGIGKVRGK
ncbi:MAG: UDP-glucose/GDP-mannose dehydrogenase family protein [Methanocalculus sp. 52_23]|nr:MAG: UDP-glucose/GDP-mannose dehydrogenase family protein [Methanocalculus sp. 52_23]